MSPAETNVERQKNQTQQLENEQCAKTTDMNASQTTPHEVSEDIVTFELGDVQVLQLRRQEVFLGGDSPRSGGHLSHTVLSTCEQGE